MWGLWERSKRPLRFAGAFLGTACLALPGAIQRALPAPKAPAADYAGRPFVTQAAPALKFEKRQTPHLRGIDYTFAAQTAQGAALFLRFPPFTLSDRRIHISGPWYSSPEANRQFSRGITSVEALPNYRQGPTDIRQVPAQHKWQLLVDPLFWSYASILADELKAANPNDERIAPLRTLAEKHEMTPSEAAYKALGRRVWQGENAPTDAHGQGVLYPAIDIERTEGFPYQRACLGWLYQGMASAATEHGARIVPITYGQWTFAVGAFYDSVRPGGTGDPEYLRPQKDFLAADDPTLQACRDNGGVVSMDGYVQAIWGEEPFYQRTPTGALRLVNGHPVFSELAKTKLYGQDVALEPGEAEHCLQDIYRQATRMYLMHHWFAGQYPARSDQRKPFLRNTRIGAWTRYTNEGLLGIQQNDRPLPGWEIEMLAGLYLFTADDLVVWSSDMNTPPAPLGADNRTVWKYNAHGVAEYVVKAAHRYSALDPLHHGEFAWCWFHLPVVDKNQAEGERPEQKPIVFGKLRTYQGKPWIEIYAAWPALDRQSTDFTLWVERNGKRSPAYTFQIANGRRYFYDAWALPAGFQKLEGKNVHLRFQDLLGKSHTWCGDWRVPADAVASREEK